MEEKLLYIVIFKIYISFYTVYSKHEKYEGHLLYKVHVKNTKDIAVVNNMVNYLYLDVWSHPLPGRSGEILVPKAAKKIFETALKADGLKFKIIVQNIRDLLKLEDRLLRTAASRNRENKMLISNFNITFDMVYGYREINTYMSYVANTFSGAEFVNGGFSYEGRPINYLKISTTKFEDESKPIVMLETLIHSREWVTSPVSLNAIRHLVVDKTEPELLNNLDWIIVPIVNPDGYDYTHSNIDLKSVPDQQVLTVFCTSNTLAPPSNLPDRLWRKNKRPIHSCTGVDLNRNFDVNWGSLSSFDPCQEDYHGEGPKSEPETRVIIDILLKYKSRIELFFDIHSFGSLIMYGYGNGTLTSNHDKLKNLGSMMRETIDRVKKYDNPNYKVGNIAEVIYHVSGCASDFAQSVGVPLSFSFELPAYQQMSSVEGFFVDPESLSQVSFETWEGIKTAAKYILKTQHNNNK